jgi:acetylglutamate kinase
MTPHSALSTQHSALVVKIGGSTLGAHDTTLEDVVALQREGRPVVIVHGGGPAVTAWMDKQGLQATFVRGLRVTDEASLDIVVAVLAGLVNKQLVAAVNALGGRAAGISGADGPTILADVTDPDYGRVGQVREVRTDLLRALLDAGMVPFLSPVGVERAAMTGPLPPVPSANAGRGGATLPPLPTGSPLSGLEGSGAKAALSPLLNINADTVAGEVAAAIGAARLVFLTDVPGVKGSDGSFVRRLPRVECEALIASGTVGGGMIPKVEACLRAAEAGAEALIVDGREPHALLAVLHGEAAGTVVG